MCWSWWFLRVCVLEKEMACQGVWVHIKRQALSLSLSLFCLSICLSVHLSVCVCVNVLWYATVYSTFLQCLTVVSISNWTVFLLDRVKHLILTMVYMLWCSCLPKPLSLTLSLTFSLTHLLTHSLTRCWWLPR